MIKINVVYAVKNIEFTKQRVTLRNNMESYLANRFVTGGSIRGLMLKKTVLSATAAKNINAAI